jgi:acetyl esterase/lipase
MQFKSETFVYKTVGSCDICADVLRPEVKTKAVRTLVYVHGGALIMGKRSSMSVAQVSRYLGAGFHVVSIDYRLAPETKLPAIIEDVTDALGWVRDTGRTIFGADPDNVAVAGCSAGGYLTLMTGICVKPRPRALVSFYGYGDIVGDWYAKPDPFYCKQSAVSREAAQLSVGKEPIAQGADDRERFYLYCRQQGLWPKEVAGWDPVHERSKFTPYCPLQNVSREYPPTLLLHGDSDTDVPYAQSAMMAGALSRAGVENSLITIEGGGHGFDYEDNADTADAMDAVMGFLRENMK